MCCFGDQGIAPGSGSGRSKCPTHRPWKSDPRVPGTPPIHMNLTKSHAQRTLEIQDILEYSPLMLQLGMTKAILRLVQKYAPSFPRIWLLAYIQGTTKQLSLLLLGSHLTVLPTATPNSNHCYSSNVRQASHSCYGDRWYGELSEWYGSLFGIWIVT